jgi:two-component system response regulator NreC
MLLERAGFEVVGEASDGQEAIRRVRDLRPDVALLDLAMPLLNGLDAAREIARVSPRTRPILLTMHSEDSHVMEALRVGIKGYVLTTQAAPDLIQAIEKVSQDGVYLSPGISRTVVESYLTKTELPSDPLSLREREVLQLVAEGKRTKEVARLLGVSVKTAAAHRSRIMAKLDIHETAGLVRYAVRQGLAQA